MYAIFSGYVAQLDAKFHKFIEKSYAQSTMQNFKSIWTKFIQFHIDNNLAIFPPFEINIRRYFIHLTNTCSAYGTLANYSSAIKLFYQVHGYQVYMSDIHMQLLMKAAKRQMSSQSKPKAPIEIPHLKFIMQNTDNNDPSQQMFLAAIMVAFFGCLRRSNVVPPSDLLFDSSKHLTRAAIKILPDSLVLVLPWTKTLQDASDVFTVVIAKPQSSPIDPVHIYTQFAINHPVLANDPAFSFYSNGRRSILTQSTLSKKLKHFLTSMGVAADAYGTHSLRRGGVTLMYASSVAPDMIRAHGTWKGCSYQKYISLSHRQKKQPTMAMYNSINAAW